MEITGPFLDRAKKLNKQPACWYLRYSTPKLNPDGTSVLDAEGNAVLRRHRPYYESRAKGGFPLGCLRLFWSRSDDADGGTRQQGHHGSRRSYWMARHHAPGFLMNS